MAINLLRMAVRIESAAKLREIQSQRIKADSKNKLYTFTRNIPKRLDELLNGGSVYWVIKRLIRIRQEIVNVTSMATDEGKKYCRIELNPTHIDLDPREQRPFQGWRYLKSEDAPLDLKKTSQGDKENILPQKMVAELKELGLL